MPAFVAKNKADLLRQALTKLQDTTPVTSIAPGSVARSIVEVVTNELGDMYEILDFNISQAFLSTAQGRALDLFGSLWNTPRKTLTEIAEINASLGSFYFYLDSPYGADVVIPVGTQVSTQADTYMGNLFTYQVTSEVTIRAGRLRSYASIKPLFADSVFTAGANTLTAHSFTPPNGVVVRCTNPKPIAAQIGYEADDSYRTRLMKAIRVAAGGTEDAIRFAILAVNGVRDIRLITAPYGLGSYELVVVPEDANAANTVVVDAAARLREVSPVGVRAFTRLPDLLPIDIRATIIFRPVRNMDPVVQTKRVKTGILRYVNTLSAGSEFIYNQLLQAIFDSTDTVADVVISRLSLNGADVARRNIAPQPFEQIIPGNIQLTTA